jgi:deoxyribonuclease-4
MRVGVHTSIAGCIANAAHRAGSIGCDTFQMFSGNPRGWRTLDPSRADCESFREARAGYGHAPVAVHGNYLINLAAADPGIRELSIAAFRREIIRSLGLGADFIVTHPGSGRGGIRSQAILTFVESLKQAASGRQLNGLVILVENTAGQGMMLGGTFEEMAEILARAGGDLPVGACIDTAHCFEAGYPIHTAKGLAQTVKVLDATVGLEKVRLIHANDSKTGFGSHADRHEHIGRGQIGREAFRRIVRHPKLCRIPFICETPVDRPGDDERNLRVMRRLAARKVPQRAGLCFPAAESRKV